MELYHPQLKSYLESLVPTRPAVLQEMEQRAAETHFPIIGPVVGHLFYLLTRLTSARRVFELGSGFGYSTAWFAMGVRENGGQYTHAAVWAAMAFAQLGDTTKAWELLHMINPADPLNSARIDTYKVEPYVMAADVYGIAPHAGRGGWTWYTGSAGWMYRLGVESLLGLQRTGNLLQLNPLMPADWPGFTLSYRFAETQYHFEVVRGDAQGNSMTLDGEPVEGDTLTLVNDGVERRVRIQCGGSRPAASAAVEYAKAADD